MSRTASRVMATKHPKGQPKEAKRHQKNKKSKRRDRSAGRSNEPIHSDSYICPLIRNDLLTTEYKDQTFQSKLPSRLRITIELNVPVTNPEPHDTKAICNYIV